MTSRVLTPEVAADTFVVIPAYNEETVIRATVEGVLTLGVHVVVVDDGSTDRTLARLADLPIYVLHHVINLGQGAALQTGIEFAVSHGARYLVTFDADGQHDEQDIVVLLSTLVHERLEVVLGSRFLGTVENIGRLRKCILKVATTLTNWTLGLSLTDVHNGLRVFRADVAGKLVISEARMAYASEFLSKLAQVRLRFREVPCTVRYTHYSKAKGQSNFEAVNILYDLALRRFSR